MREAEVVLDDELLYDDAPRRSTFMRREERPEDIVREGEVLAGKYRVERIPGRNGLGVVVQVRHLELGQEVTLKFLVPEACAYPEFVQRFVREARSAVRIQGEHVARVTDVGRLESGAPYMVREFLRGPDLAEVSKVRGPLPIEEAVDYIIQASEGVAEGHALGVVHRNLRPTSLVVARRSDGTPLIKVFDFAASESLHVNPFTERAVSLVGTSAIMASLPYLAPEQIRDPHDVDFRADIYSLGAVLYELLTGSPVYSGDAAPGLLAQVAADPAPALRTLRQDVPGELDHIVLRCLAKNRAIRYSSLAELALALRPFASQESSSSIDHIVRLGKRTAKLPELSEGRLPSPLPPAPSVVPSSPPQAGRGRNGTLLLHTAEVAARQSFAQARGSVHDDVTTINPYAAYAAPVVINPEPIRTEPLPPVRPLSQAAPPRMASRPPVMPPPLTPPPPRMATPTPLPMPSQALPTALPPAEQRADTTALPPAPQRTSISGMSRSWAAPEEPKAPLFTQRRLAVAAIAACATLGAVFAVRAVRSVPAPVAAAAAPVVPARAAAPPPAPEPAPVVPEAVPAASASAPVVASAVAPAALVAPAAPAAPAAVAAPAVVAPAPAPVAAVVPRPAAPARPPVARRPTAEAAPAAPRKPTQATEQKVASARPAAASDLFDNPR